MREGGKEVGLCSFLIPPEGGFREDDGRSLCHVTYSCSDLPTADVPHGPFRFSKLMEVKEEDGRRKRGGKMEKKTH